MNVTSDLEKVFVETTKLCKNLSHQKMTPEHLFLILLDSIKNIPKKDKIKGDLRISLEKLPRISPIYEVGYSYETINILNELSVMSKEKPITPEDVFKALLKNDKIITILDRNLTEQEKINLKKNIKSMNEVESSEFSINMIEEAKADVYDPVIGRAQEIRSIIEILSKKTKSNVILAGDPGTGKTAIVQGLAQMIAKGEASNLNNYELLNIDITGIVAGTGIKGEFEKRMKALLTEIESKKNVIVFIDEIHMALNAGSSGRGSMDMGNILKPALARGLKCIGATTHAEYRKYIEADAAFSRRFMKVNIDEPSVDNALTMLRGLKERFEAHHGIHIRDDALKFAAKSKKYLTGRRLPDLAIDLIDTACASKIIESTSESGELLRLKDKLWSLKLERATLEIDLKRAQEITQPNRSDIENIQKRITGVEDLIEDTQTKLEEATNDFEKEKTAIFNLKTLRQKLHKYNQKLEEAKRTKNFFQIADISNHTIPQIEEDINNLKKNIFIDSDDVASVVSRWTKIPTTRLTLKESDRIGNMTNRLSREVFGQDLAIKEVVNSIIQHRLGLSDSGKPISFMFLGPTGVGKTELAKCLALELFDSKDKLTVLDMSDYADAMSVTKLIGASAGYIGYEEGGTLTEPVKQKPFNVILLDEFDLANKKVLNILYQLLDEGRITDGKRAVIDFKNTVIIMTSNIGSDEILNSINGNIDTTSIQSKLNNQFGEAFTNRIDKILYFNGLSMDVLEHIFEQQLNLLNIRLSDKNIRLKVTNEVKKDLIEKSYSPIYGARPLKRNVQRLMEGVTHLILGGLEEGVIEINFNSGQKVGDYFYKVLIE